MSLQRSSGLGTALVILVAVLATSTVACESGRPARIRTKDDTDGKPLIAATFSDNFERAELGPDWKATQPGLFRIDNGELRVKNGYNHPLWLMRKLPQNVQIDLDITSHGPQGDLKVEFFGDGKSFAADKGAYTSSGYVAIFGGWNNSVSTLVRQFEHDPDRKERKDVKVEQGRKYHFTIVRQGTRVAWSIDREPFLEITDAQPLSGKGHEFFGFNNWEVETTIDNLVISPLAGAIAVPQAGSLEDPSAAGR